MWTVEVRSGPSQVYKKLKEAFQEEHVSEVIDEKNPKLGKRSKTEPGVSEQFIHAAKYAQSLAEIVDRTAIITLQGEPGQSITIKIEAV